MRSITVAFTVVRWIVSLPANATMRPSRSSPNGRAAPRCGGTARHGAQTEGLSDLARLFRSCDCDTVDEGRAGSVGRKQQSVPSGFRQRSRRSENRESGARQTWHFAQAARRDQWAISGGGASADQRAAGGVGTTSNKEATQEIREGSLTSA